jgi:flagellar biogenesis protein FliO
MKTLTITLSLFLVGCSASWHFGRFIKKGGQVGTKIELVETTDTIRINGKDSVILIKVPVTCPDVKIPPTRQEIRYKYKIQRDSIKTVRYVTKWKTKEVVKVAKSESKKPFNWFWIGLAVGFVIAVVIRLIWEKL